MNYKYVPMRVIEKNNSREILVNPSFQETRQLVASKTLRTFISVKFCDYLRRSSKLSFHLRIFIRLKQNTGGAEGMHKPRRWQAKVERRTLWWTDPITGRPGLAAGADREG